MAKKPPASPQRHQPVMVPQKRRWTDRLFGGDTKAPANGPSPRSARTRTAIILAVLGGLCALAAVLLIWLGHLWTIATLLSGLLALLLIWLAFVVSQTLERRLWALFFGLMGTFTATLAVPVSAIRAGGEILGLNIDAAFGSDGGLGGSWALLVAAIVTLLAIVVLRRA